MNKYAYLLILLVVGVVLAAVIVPGISRARIADPLVSTDWLNKHMADKSVVVVDIRTGANYAFAHIPHAVSIPYTNIEPKDDNDLFMLPSIGKITELFRNAGVNRKSHVIVYGHGNTVSDASKAAATYWALKAMGHRNVSMLDGGFTKWTFEGRVVTKEVPKVKKGNFKAVVDTSLIADMDEVAKAVKSRRAVLVDARNSIQYFGHEKRADVICFGHIPGAINLPADFLSNAGINRAPATVKSKDDLLKIVRGVGIPEDKSVPIIVYCNTAQLAGLNYLVLKDLLGYTNVKVFDGSMLEYCNLNGKLPVERFSWSLNAPHGK